MKDKPASTIRDFFNILYRRIYILKFVVVALPLAALVACFIVNPIYESSAKVIVTGKRENATLLQGPKESSSSTYVNLNVDEADLNSEMELLLSLDLWMRTVQKLGLKFFEQKKKSSIRASIERVERKVADVLGDSEKRAGAAGNGEPLQIRQAAESLVGKFKVTPTPKSKVLELSFKDSDPQRAQQILSTLLELYVPYHLEMYSLPGAQKFFSGLGTKYWEEFQKADREVGEFKKKWSIAFPDRQKSELIAQIKQIQDGVVDLDSNLSQYQNMLTSLKQGIVPTGQLTPSMQRGTENTVINVIATQLLRAEQKKQQVLEFFTHSSRDARVAEEAVTDLMKKLQDSLQSETETIVAKKESLEESLKVKQAQLRDLEEKSEAARQLQVAASIAKERYLQYVGKEEEARMDDLRSTDKLANVRVMGKPFTPTTPIFPKTGLFVLGAFLMAIPMGIGIILTLNFFDHTFMSPHEVTTATGLPVLATLTKLPKTGERRA